MELLITDAEAAAIWKRVSAYKENALIRLYKRDVTEFLADRKALLAEVARLTLALAESEMAHAVVFGDPQQVSAEIYFFALDSSHGDYATTEATLSTSLSGRIATLAAIVSPTQAQRNELSELRRHGAYANIDGGNGYTGLKIVGPCYGLNGLSISASGVCRDIVNYSKCRNPNYAAVTNRTNAWGDTYKVWGKFLKAPTRIPTTGYDRLLAHMKGQGSDTVLFVAQTATGDGSGDSYGNAKAVKDILAIDGINPTHEPANYDILVLCGTLSRHFGEGAQSTITAGNGFQFKNGSAAARTQILAHPVDGCTLMAHVRLGYGTSRGDPADWTDEGGGMFSCAMSSATITLDGDRHSVTNAGGTLRPLTKVASSAACAALADSVFLEADYSGTNDRVYVRLADGSNPKTTTFIPTTSGGITLIIAALTYFDVYGVEFVGNVWIGSGQTGSNNYTWYACKFKYWGNLRCFGCSAGVITQATGAFSYDQPTDRSWIGCEWNVGYVAVYDTNGRHNRVPLRTQIKDCYFYGLNPIAADGFGVDCFSAADAHSIATQGADGFLIDNCSFDLCGGQTITHYILPNNFTTPTGGLENTDGYTDGLQYPAKCFPPNSTTFTFPGRLRDSPTRYCLIINPRVTGEYAGADPMAAIAYQGDNGSLLDLAGGQYDGNIIEHNRIEGAITTGAIRYRLAHGVESECIDIRHNTIRGAVVGFNALMTVSVDGGSTYNPSFRFGPGNDVHATTYFVQNQNILNDGHLFYFDGNIYRNDAGADWRDGGDVRTTLASWDGAALSGDTHDPNSTHVALGA